LFRSCKRSQSSRKSSR